MKGAGAIGGTAGAVGWQGRVRSALSLAAERRLRAPSLPSPSRTATAAWAQSSSRSCRRFYSQLQATLQRRSRGPGYTATMPDPRDPGAWPDEMAHLEPDAREAMWTSIDRSRQRPPAGDGTPEIYSSGGNENYRMNRTTI